ncbi:hypothetical protein sr11142 [Sporisorium reilianum SRZ2]|uniref:Uncharacterized protein n=1 Tax=Sporisorium reilianum (strain SRZ2) TaxID=999809 RepID=E7A371_SPORE|nr:hypothetical protein sr11142 [Sporisorium reilianum SRZ2]
MARPSRRPRDGRQVEISDPEVLHTPRQRDAGSRSSTAVSASQAHHRRAPAGKSMLTHRSGTNKHRGTPPASNASSVRLQIDMDIRTPRSSSSSARVGTHRKKTKFWFPLPRGAVREKLSDYPDKREDALAAGFVLMPTTCAYCVKNGVVCTVGTGVNKRGQKRTDSCDLCHMHMRSCENNPHPRNTRQRREHAQNAQHLGSLRALIEHIPSQRAYDDAVRELNSLATRLGHALPNVRRPPVLQQADICLVSTHSLTAPRRSRRRSTSPEHRPRHRDRRRSPSPTPQSEHNSDDAESLEDFHSFLYEDVQDEVITILDDDD